MALVPSWQIVQVILTPRLQPLITTAPEASALAAHLSREARVGLDTEFLRERTYRAQLCLLQLSSAGEAACVDPLAVTDLTALAAVLTSGSVTKVMHASRQDLEVLLPVVGLVRPVFDTQIAASLGGFPAQVGYAELVRRLLGHELAKLHTRTDWSQRPLGSEQIEYALDDVRYLLPLAEQLEEQLAKLGRRDWLDDEMKTLNSPSTYEQHPERAWERYRTKARKPRDLAVLMELAAWRESEAQARDVPRARVLKDDVLIELALAAPRTLEALANLRAFPRGMERSRAGGEILAAIERGLARDPKTLPKIERDRRNGANVGPTVELLKVLLRQVSEESGVAGKLIATVDDLESIASSDKAQVPALTGWRRKLFGDRALELKHGRLALTVENGKVVTLEWKDAEAPNPVA